MGLARASIRNAQAYFAGRRLQGASTITQQVAKNFLLTSERTLTRKLKEALLALRIERAFDKKQILQLYLNEIYFGLGSYGVAAASLNYFGKSLHELNLAEMAYLAALPKAPSNYHPFRRAKQALDRRNWVIRRMLINGYITEAQAERAEARPLDVKPRQFGAQLFAADYFAEEVRRRVYERYGEKRLYEGGLSVRTTLNPKLQVIARKALVAGLVGYDRSQGWRGPVKQIALAGEWGAALAKIEIPTDIKPWELAVVLKADRKKAVIGIRPGRLKSGKFGKQRLTGEIAFKEMSWARAAGEQKDGKKKKLGPKPKAVTDVLNPGDVIYAAPVEGAKGQWQLMQIPKVEGALVAMDPHTGRVHALVGGFSYGTSQFNRAVQALRQPGSSFKPIVYAAALDNGYTPASLVMDAPIEIEQGRGLGLWRPKNYGNDFFGPSTLRIGIERSRNVMTVRLAQDMGMEMVVDYAKRFGIYANLMPVLSMSLGAGETTVLKMTAAFSMLANGGRKITPALIDRIQDRNGKTIFRHDARQCDDCKARDWNNQKEPVLPDVREQIIDQHTAYQVVSMLEGVVKRGTAVLVSKVGKPLAGKTGTTNDEKDAWFVGFSPDLAVGVYIGFDQPTPMGREASGGRLAAPVFANFMTMALKDKPAIPFRAPPGLNLIPIDSKTGLPAALGQDGVILEAFKPGEGPPEQFLVIGSGDNWLPIDPRTNKPLVQTPGTKPGGVLSSGTGGLY
jgi:penicillin-binding protein 1A